MKNKTSNKKGKIFTKNRVRILQKLIEKLSVCRQEMFEINSKKPNDNLLKMKKHLLCSTCKNYHPQHDDGFDYLDCMLYIKKRNGKKKSNSIYHGRGGFITQLFKRIYSL